jgi:hypothetical protein
MSTDSSRLNNNVICDSLELAKVAALLERTRHKEGVGMLVPPDTDSIMYAVTEPGELLAYVAKMNSGRGNISDA